MAQYLLYYAFFSGGGGGGGGGGGRVWWPSGRAPDSELRSPGFDPHMRHCVVSLSKANTG